MRDRDRKEGHQVRGMRRGLLYDKSDDKEMLAVTPSTEWNYAPRARMVTHPACEKDLRLSLEKD